MSWQFGLSVYLVIWWVTIFLVLPWGNQTIGSDDVAEGQDAGAPARPRLLLKVAINTVVAGVCWIGFYFAYTGGYLEVSV